MILENAQIDEAIAAGGKNVGSPDAEGVATTIAATTTAVIGKNVGNPDVKDAVMNMNTVNVITSIIISIRKWIKSGAARSWDKNANVKTVMLS